MSDNINNIELSEQQKQERRERLNQRSAEHIHANANSRLRKYLIRLMRVALPLIGFAIIFVLFLVPQFENQVIEPTFDAEKVKQTLERVEMEKPQYRSFDDKQNPYTINADSAVRDTKVPDAVDLKKPTASIEMKDGKMLNIEATNGNYAQDQSSLTLQGDVVLKDNNGYNLTTDELFFDLNDNSAKSTKPVKGTGAKGTIESEGLIIQDNGNQIIFNGKSKLILK